MSSFITSPSSRVNYWENLGLKVEKSNHVKYFINQMYFIDIMYFINNRYKYTNRVHIARYDPYDLFWKLLSIQVVHLALQVMFFSDDSTFLSHMSQLPLLRRLTNRLLISEGS